MTSFDFFILAMIGLSVLFAWIRGLSREVITLLAIGIGLLAIKFFGAGFSSLFGSGTVGPLIGLGVLFLLAFVVGSVALEILTARFMGGKPGFRDKIAGAAFGLLRGWLIVGLAYLALTYYFDEDDMPPAIENAALKGLTTSGASLLEQLGLEKETSGPESADAQDAE